MVCMQYWMRGPSLIPQPQPFDVKCAQCDFFSILEKNLNYLATIKPNKNIKIEKTKTCLLYDSKW